MIAHRTVLQLHFRQHNRIYSILPTVTIQVKKCKFMFYRIKINIERKFIPWQTKSGWTSIQPHKNTTLSLSHLSLPQCTGPFIVSHLIQASTMGRHKTKTTTFTLNTISATILNGKICMHNRSVSAHNEHAAFPKYKSNCIICTFYCCVSEVFFAQPFSFPSSKS